ncbi:MAG TPA: nicotinate-nucleotide adenylyltransferase [Armatimonadota bacterium]|jgi:nicotinate-nucleotide adenylyltransferase
MRLGVFGGTFDPIHYGHLRIAEAAREALSLDSVMFVPVGVPVHRQVAPHGSAEARYQMCRLATEDNPAFEVSRIETDAQSPCFTVDTLARLRMERPDAEIRLIIGADEAAIYPTWREPRTIVKQARLAVAMRPGIDAAELQAALPRWVIDAMDVLPPIFIGISSTDIRARLTAGKSVRYLLPAPVEMYIEKNRLYRP